MTIAGQRVSYVAETGMLPLLKPDGTIRASIFYVAYMKQGESSMERRPVTFCFNGGPGSASVWLHLGALGPRRVKLSEPDATQPAAVRPGRQRVLHSARYRSGVHRSGGHRLQSAGRGGQGRAVLREIAGHRVGGRVRSALDHAARAMAFAEIRLRRELRRLPRRRIGASPAFALRNESQRIDLRVRRCSTLLACRAICPARFFCRRTRPRRTFTRSCRPTCKPTCPRRWPKPASSCGRSMRRRCFRARR